MRELKSTQRRRRLRIIKAKDARAEERIRGGASAADANPNLQKYRENAELNRQRLASECGARLPTRIRVEHPARETQLILMNRAHLLIGSEPACDLQLDHDAVHPRHALLQWVDGHLFYCDLAPREGNDQNSRPNGHWVDDRPISIGPFQLYWEEAVFPVPPVASPLDRSPALSAHLPHLALQFLGVEQSDNKWPINRLLTVIGRGSQCKLRLNHPSMPHVQACLIRTQNSCWLIDVVRTGTTGVNGRAIRMAGIGIGDVLQLGPFRVEVVATTFTPIKVSPPSPPPGDENSVRNKVKLFAPSTADLGLSSSKGGRKNSPPPKSPSLVDSSDVNSSITEISKGTSSGRRTKRPAPATTILDEGRGVNLKVPARSADPTPTLRTSPVEQPDTNSIAGRPSIGISASTYPAEVETPLTAAGSTNQSVLYEAPVDGPPHLAAQVISTSAETFHVSVDDYVREHQLQLARLQTQLDDLLELCNRPSRHSISKRVRSQLEQSIRETVRTQQEMREALASLLKSVSG